MKIWTRLGLFVVGFLILAVAGIFLAQKDLEHKSELALLPKRTALPEMRITLNDATLDEVKQNGKDVRYLGNWLQLGDLAFEDVEVKGRGNATWGQIKKPYQIKLSQKADLLDLGKRRKWILISSYWDDADLRTDTAFYLEKMVGEDFAYKGDYVELYVNDEYEGLYYLVRGIEVGKNAVNLRDPLGVLVELDNIYGKMEEKFFITNNGECLTVKDVVAKDNADLALASFGQAFNALEEAVRARDYATLTKVADVESFAEYYLISEFTANPDAYFTSQYFYKDGPEDKIHAGPAWDFDISLNNTGDRDIATAGNSLTKTIATEELEDKEAQYGYWSRLFARLIKMPEFETEVKRVFQERMSGRKDELIQHMFKQAARIYPEAMRDSEKWGKGDFVRGVKNLLDWVSQRFDYFEVEYGEKA